MEHTDSELAVIWSGARAAFETQQVEDEKRPLTVSTYREDLDAFHDWHVNYYTKPPELARLTAADLRQWKAFMREERHLKAASVNRKLSAMRSFLRWAQSAGLAPPVKSPKAIPQVRQPPRWLSRRDMLAFVRSAERASKRDRAVAILLLHTGARVGELADGTWRDVTVSARKGSIILHGKRDKDRTVPLNLESRAALQDLGYPGPSQDASLVNGQRGQVPGEPGPLGRQGIQKIIEDIAADAKLEKCTCHTLRHTFCRRLAEQGTRLEQIADLAGHKSLETTRGYVTPGKEELAAEVERLAGSDE